jgi:3-methyl-2-oxobutanoate hydroxymethyltransferase
MVARGLRDKFLVADLPFLSFRQGPAAALDAVGALMRAGAHAVKLEGVWGHEDVVARIVQSGVPVMGHIGLTPQSVHALGGFRVQGKQSEQARDLIAQARELEKLGCFAIVLECVPATLAREITAELKIPTIGIGAGVGTDGQVLVFQDMLGLGGEFSPKFLRRYLQGGQAISGALASFCRDVQDRTFPNEQESYT